VPLPRCGVVDLGSNFRPGLWFFEGHTRNPVPIFNEKAVLRLGRGMQTTGMLNEGRRDAGADRDASLSRHRARDGVRSHSRCWRTAAVRGRGITARTSSMRCKSGCRACRFVFLLGKVEEAAYAAEGMLCGIPARERRCSRISAAAPWRSLRLVGGGTRSFADLETRKSSG